MLFSKHFRPELIVSKDEAQPTLAHAHLDGARILATNGAAAVSIPCHPVEADEHGAISVDALKHARTVARRKKADELFVAATDALRTEDDAEFVRPRPEGTEAGFPNLAPLFDGAPQPEAGRTLTVRLNAALLAKLARAMGLEVVELTLDRDNPLSPIRVAEPGAESGDESRPFGVLMPCGGGE